MTKIKQYPKQAIVSLVLLAVSLMLIWTNWINLNDLPGLAQVVPELQDGGLSFFDGHSFPGILSELERIDSSPYYLEAPNQTIVNLLSYAHQIMLICTVLSVLYCAYARLAWKSGYSEGIYFLIFIGDFGLMFLMMNELNSIFIEKIFSIGFGGIAALICALISEILWEEASFNTPKLPISAVEEPT